MNKVLILVGMLYSGMALATQVTLKYEQWDMPRHGEALVKQPVLDKIVRAWDQDPEKRIELRYPGGEEGELWVRELMDWLIALGVPSGSMVASPGSGADDVIKLVLIEGSKNHE